MQYLTTSYVITAMDFPIFKAPFPRIARGLQRRSLQILGLVFLRKDLLDNYPQFDILNWEDELLTNEEISPWFTNKYLTIFLEMAQYGLVSVSALAVDVGLLYVLVEYAAFHHIHAATISFTCGWR